MAKAKKTNGDLNFEAKLWQAADKLPSRYVGTGIQEEHYEVFEEKMKCLTGELSGQLKKSDKLEAEIKNNLKKLEYEL